MSQVPRKKAHDAPRHPVHESEKGSCARSVTRMIHLPHRRVCAERHRPKAELRFCKPARKCLVSLCFGGWFLAGGEVR
jgi:hypothetical protein